MHSQVRAPRLPGKRTAPGCSLEEGKEDGSGVTLRSMFCLEALAPADRVDVPETRTAYLGTVAGRVRKAETVQGGFEEHNNWL